MQAFCKKKEKLGPLRNEALLNFVSLRSHFDSVGRRGPSRIEMNALWAPLTALYVSAEMEIVFSLDIADAFIEADFWGPICCVDESYESGCDSVEEVARVLCCCWWIYGRRNTDIQIRCVFSTKIDSVSRSPNRCNSARVSRIVSEFARSVG
jgi:hypothetical protein